MYPFSYHVILCGEYTDFKNEELHGVTFGHNMAEAMAHVESYYGNQVVKCEICSIGDEAEVIELDLNAVDELEREAV